MAIEQLLKSRKAPAQKNVAIFEECWLRGRDDIAAFARDFLDVEPHQGEVIWWARSEKPNAEEAVLSCANRWGKIFSAGVKLLHHAFYQIRPEKYVYDKAGRFRPYRAINIALSLDQAMIAWNEALRLARDSQRFAPFLIKHVGAPFPYMQISNKGKGKDRVVSEIWARSTAKRAKFLLGKSFNFLNYDEAAFDVDGEVILEQVLRMRMTDEAGKMDFTSSPNGKNWFYRLWELGQDPNNPLNYSRSAPIWENPNVDHAKARRNMAKMSPDWVKQNILGLFADFANIFSVTDIGKCTREQDYAEKMPIPFGYEVYYEEVETEEYGGHEAKIRKCSKLPRYVIGADLAIKRDKTVIIVLKLGENGSPHQMVAIEEHSRTNWETIYGAIQRLAASYGNCRVLIDSTAASAQLEALQNRGLNVYGYDFSGSGVRKEALILTAQEALQNQAIRFPHIPELVNQLIYYDWKDKGLDTDYVFGFCLALECAKQATDSQTMETTDSGIYVIRGGGYLVGDRVTRIDEDDDDFTFESFAAALL